MMLLGQEAPINDHGMVAHSKNESGKKTSSRPGISKGTVIPDIPRSISREYPGLPRTPLFLCTQEICRKPKGEYKYTCTHASTSDITVTGLGSDSRGAKSETSTFLLCLKRKLRSTWGQLEPTWAQVGSQHEVRPEHVDRIAARFDNLFEEQITKQMSWAPKELQQKTWDLWLLNNYFDVIENVCDEDKWLKKKLYINAIWSSNPEVTCKHISSMA